MGLLDAELFKQSGGIIGKLLDRVCGDRAIARLARVAIVEQHTLIASGCKRRHVRRQPFEMVAGETRNKNHGLSFSGKFIVHVQIIDF
jgi:hypothetical protein